MQFNTVIESNEETVVTHYEPLKNKSDAYQSEEALEKEFIRLLTTQGYDYLKIHNENDLIKNLRVQIEKLNNLSFSDNDWNRFLKTILANPNNHIVEKTRIIQEDNIQPFTLETGELKNIIIIDKKNIHNNSLQVINQYEIDSGNHSNRYDVTILVNGLPLVHCELKRRGVAIREAFNQIDRYQRDSFWSGCGLYEYIQIFVISNGTNTKYYSNTTRFNHIEKKNGKHKSKTSDSFDFTSYWATTENKTLNDLVDFTRTFFAKHSILNVLTKYCVFDSDNKLLVMRPYQITATERILNRILIANNYKYQGSVKAGGYIWHTTGSGKTLTSFKTAKLATELDFIDKVLFVVDRKDLDYQTMKEYDRFEKGCANASKSTTILQKNLESKDGKIVITTIQKLSNFIAKNDKHDVYSKNVVMIFDECHRSQFGEMHAKIIKRFKKYYIFGFTGTPIFAVNASTSGKVDAKTTEQAFGDKLHTYTIIDAINDKNVLPFKVDYIKTMEKETDIDDKDVYDIDREKAYMAPERIKIVSEYIFKHFNDKTYRNQKSYSLNSTLNISEVVKGKKETKEAIAKNGFNSIFAVASIDMAKIYYNAFKKLNKDNPNSALKVAIIYSYEANQEEPDFVEEENSDDTNGLSLTDRDFLDEAINDYNLMFKTNYDTSSDNFSNYYKDVSLRMKNKEIDMLIVVGMFLTGFDATTLNTLWVDKNLKMHGLIQAFSRTNRILNSIKRFGNIVCFRNLKNRTDSAISVFGNKDAGGIILLKTFADYFFGYDDEEGKHHKGYVELLEELRTKYPLGEQIIGEKNKKEFVKLFGAFLRAINVLSSFDDYTNEDNLDIQAKKISDLDLQDYKSIYLDIKDELTGDEKQLEDINDDIVFETELLESDDINVDYILMLVEKYKESNSQNKEIILKIQKSIDASPLLRSKKKLIEGFIEGINDIDDIATAWKKYVEEQKEKKLDEIIASENLKPEETKKFVALCFKDGELKTNGAELVAILPPVSMFGGAREKKKNQVIEKLKEFFDVFAGVYFNNDEE